MNAKKPTTIAQYIQAAPTAGQPHLKRIYAILKSVAPDARGDQVEYAVLHRTAVSIRVRRFQVALHVCATAATLEHFGKELKAYKTTQNYLPIPYADEVPEDLIRRMAQHCVEVVAAREDDSFW